MKTSTLTLFFLIFIGLLSFSQSSIDTDFLTRIYGDTFVRAEFVKTTAFTNLSSQEEIRLTLFRDLTIIAKKNSNVRELGGSELWEGKLVSGAEGYLELFSRRGKIKGTVYTNSNVYKLNGTIEGDLQVIEIKPDDLQDHFDDHDDTIQNDKLEGASSKALTSASALISADATATNPAIIDVMILYPPSLPSSIGGADDMEDEVYHRIAEANQIFSNSNIYVEFRLAHHQAVTSVPEDADSTDDVKTNEVKDLRDQYKADLVSFWNIGGATGTGSNFNSTPGNPDNGYNTSNFSAIQSQYTFIHECGHNMGAKHDRQTYYDDSPTSSKLELTSYYRYGKSFVGYRSIMSYNNCNDLPGGSSGDCERIPYFTNPDIIINGAPFGVEGNFQTYDPDGPSDNARRINEIAPFVEAYYDNPNPVTPVTEYYDLTVNNGQGSGSYEEGDVVSISANDPDENMIFDQWIGDIDEIDDVYEASTSITITNEDLLIRATYKLDNSLSVEDYEQTPIINIFPNPVTDILNIYLNNSDATFIEIINMMGQVLVSKEITKEKEELDMVNLNSGLYIIKLKKGNQIHTKTIVKQ